jgi:hypothetical protein
MRYDVQFQYRPRSESLPQALPVAFEITSDVSPFLLPAPGDHVVLGEQDDLIRYVETRLFVFSGGEEPSCAVNIVLTDSELSDRAELIESVRRG